MKKITKILKLVSVFIFLSLSIVVKGQGMSFSLTPGSGTICSSGNTPNGSVNYITCALTGTVPGANYYTYTMSPGCSIFSISYNGPLATIGLWCSSPGTHTVYGLAYASNSNSVVLSSATNTLLALANSSVSITGPNMICPNSVNTYSASGANSYSWRVYNGTSTYTVLGAVASLTTGSYASFSLTATAANGCTNVTYFNPFVGAASVSISQGTVCLGNSAILTANGANSYTWSNGSNAGSIVVSPSVNTTYSLTAANNSCTVTSTHFIAVVTVPTLTISPAQTICSGNWANFSVSGAYTYTWLNVPTSTSNPFSSANPLVNTCYTVIGQAAAQCPTVMATTCVSVIPSPTLNVSGNFTICPGSSNIYSASGANSYTWFAGPNFTAVANSATIITSAPFVVYGAGANGCVVGNTILPTFLPTPSLTILSSVAGSFVCEGSSLIYTASGANSYTWSTGANTTTISVIAGSFANYSPLGFTVSGTGGVNGCIGSTTVSPWNQTSTCSIVWPGDANRDGVVSNTDIFEIGLAINSTGAARTNTSNAWLAQYVTNWTGTVSTGWNKSHADCNGDGTINLSDTLAIHNNFSLTHAFKLSNSSSANSDINLILPAVVAVGDWNKADVMLGDVSTPISQLYGLAFDVNIDQNLLDNNQAYLLYSSSFLNTGNQNIEFKKNNISNGKIYAASVRVDGTNVSGGGKIGELWFKVDPNAINNSVLNLSVSNSVKIGNTGVVAVLSSGSSSTTVSNSPTKLNENSLFERALSFYPNPANNQVILRNSLGSSVNYSLIDVLGRELLKGEFNQSKTLDVSNLASGAYFIKFESAKQSAYKKLVIEK